MTVTNVTTPSLIHRLARWGALVVALVLSIGVIGFAAERMVRGTMASASHEASADVMPSVDDELLHDLPHTDAPRPATLIPAIPIARDGMMLMEVTAYCPCSICCGPKAMGITASGRPVSHNGGKFVAADTRLLPFGTKLSIPGYHAEESVEVIDRGGAIKGNKLDVYFPTHAEARQWGRQWLVVHVEQ